MQFSPKHIFEKKNNNNNKKMNMNSGSRSFTGQWSGNITPLPKYSLI